MYALWKNAPPWVVLTRDIVSYLLGILGMAYLILTGSGNVILILGCLSLTGIPGIGALVTLFTGQGTVTTQPSPPVSPTGTTTPQSLPQSRPQSPS